MRSLVLEYDPLMHLGTEQKLPIDSSLVDIAQAFARDRNVIVLAEPGAGKSTRLPPYLAWHGPAAIRGRWILLQPRRIAARTLAERIAAEGGFQVGTQVGYEMRFEKQSSAATELLIVTEGTLVQRLNRDPELAGYQGVLLDEFHERSLHADVALARLKEIQSSLRPDLRIGILSATLETQAIEKYLDQPTIFRVPGVVFPVTTRHEPDLSVTDAVVEAFRQTRGNILVFLPGLREIDQHRADAALSKELKSATLQRLHSTVPRSELDASLSAWRAGDPRRILFSTNIAETSLTVPGIEAVVDSGWMRRVRFDSGIGSEIRETVRISRASADQRRGRAGRTAPGICIRLWSLGEHAALRTAETPEILQADLARVQLELAEWGTLNPAEIAWLSAPSPSQWKQAADQLTRLRLVESSGGLTDLGRAVLRVPLPPRFATLAIHLFESGHWTTTQHRVYSLTDGNGGSTPAPSFWSAQLQDRLAQATRSREKNQHPAARAWALAFSDRIASRSVSGRWVLTSGMEVKLAERLDPGITDTTTSVIALETREIRGQSTLVEGILVVTTLLDQWLPERRQLATPDDSAEADEQPASEQLQHFLRRCRYLAFHEPALAADLPGTAEQWLAVTGCSTLSELERLFPKSKRPEPSPLPQYLPHPLQKALKEWVPESIVTERRVRLIRYPEDPKNPPDVDLRIQEAFRFPKTPTVLKGKMKLRVHLLSPAERPMQVTQDLESFWKSGYAEVRRELRARYPKHPWPEDPFSARE